MARLWRELGGVHAIRVPPKEPQRRGEAEPQPKLEFKLQLDPERFSTSSNKLKLELQHREPSQKNKLLIDCSAKDAEETAQPADWPVSLNAESFSRG